MSTKSKKRQQLKSKYMNKKVLPIKGMKLEPLDKRTKETIVPMISEEDLSKFETVVNQTIETNIAHVAPWYLQYGGFLIAVIIMCLGMIAISFESVITGASLLVMGVLIAFVSFWYRGQIIRRSWKHIASDLKQFFARCSKRYPGVSFEFHTQGHFQKIVKTKKGRKGKEVKERSNLWIERSIVLMLPGDQSLYHSFVEDVRSADEIVKSDTKPIDGYKTYISDEPVTLPFWWSMAKNRDGKVYYINNLKQTTQWHAPTMEEIGREQVGLKQVLAPPKIRNLHKS